MSTAAHTPRPWRSEGAPEFVNSTELWCGWIEPTSTESYRGRIATVQSCDHITGITRDEAAANARLIAAAPDLLEAVTELLATHPAAYREPNAIDNRTDNAVRIARAAIAKATGGAV